MISIRFIFDHHILPLKTMYVFVLFYTFTQINLIFGFSVLQSISPHRRWLCSIWIFTCWPSTNSWCFQYPIWKSLLWSFRLCSIWILTCWISPSSRCLQPRLQHQQPQHEFVFSQHMSKRSRQPHNRSSNCTKLWSCYCPRSSIGCSDSTWCHPPFWVTTKFRKF